MCTSSKKYLPRYILHCPCCKINFALPLSFLLSSTALFDCIPIGSLTIRNLNAMHFGKKFIDARKNRNSNKLGDYVHN